MVKVEIPEWQWNMIAKIANALGTDGEKLIASMLAGALLPLQAKKFFGGAQS